VPVLELDRLQEVRHQTQRRQSCGRRGSSPAVAESASRSRVSRGGPPHHLCQQLHCIPQLPIRQVGCRTEPKPLTPSVGPHSTCVEAPRQRCRDRGAEREKSTDLSERKPRARVRTTGSRSSASKDTYWMDGVTQTRSCGLMWQPRRMVSSGCRRSRESKPRP
jgi:hypothetical protein